MPRGKAVKALKASLNDPVDAILALTEEVVEVNSDVRANPKNQARE